VNPIARSWLFVPGDDERKIARGLSGAADAVILDWEDAVATSRKEDARRITCQVLDETSPSGNRRWIRLNGMDTPAFEDDLQALPAAQVEGVVLPKARGPQALADLDRRLAQVENAAGVPVGRLKVMGIVTEDAASVLALSEFRQPVPRLVALLWGGEDLAADLGIRYNRDDAGHYRATFRLARDLTLLAAGAARAAAIDAVYTDVRNLECLRQESEQAVADGFAGKAAIHPDQVAVIRAAFEPDAQQVDWARRVVESLSNEAGVALLDGKMIDRPHLRLAKRILGLAPDGSS
jgi:citrate lyase subunit beta/citryl-CoA lyase